MINEFDKYKPKNSSIKFEDIKLKKVYAFTLNPKDGGNTSSQLLLRQDAYVLREIKGSFGAIAHCLKSAKITLKTEASATGRIHYHGWVVIYDHIQWISEIKMLCNLGTVCIKEITEEKEWNEYCSKQDHIWRPFFAKTNMAYPYEVPIPVQLYSNEDD